MNWVILVSLNGRLVFFLIVVLFIWVEIFEGINGMVSVVRVSIVVVIVVFMLFFNGLIKGIWGCCGWVFIFWWFVVV